LTKAFARIYSCGNSSRFSRDSLLSFTPERVYTDAGAKLARKGLHCYYISTVSADNYELRPIDLQDSGIQSITSLLRDVFPHASHFNKEVIDWQYRRNPDGVAIGCNAWSGDELAGHYAAIPLQAELFGKTEKGLLSLNTATHEKHRGKGLFTRLATATYEQAAKEGYSFVVGVANANSTHGFTKKLDFQLVAPLRAMVGLGGFKQVNSKKTLDFKPRWTSEKMAWRTAHPAHKYSRYSNGRQEFILSDTVMKGFQFMLSTNKNIPSTMLQDGIVPLRKAYIGLDPDMKWRGTLFFNVPKRFRQAPLNLIFRDLTGEQRQLNPDKVRFQAMDFDTL